LPTVVEYALISVVSADIRFSDPEFHKRETTLLACRNATLEDFAAVIDAILAHKNSHGGFQHASLDAVRGPEVLPRWSDPASGVIKALVDI